MVVQPSTMEGLSIALLEALSYGRCVLLSDIPENLEVGEDYALLVHDEGKAFTLERFSGGEGDLANLCLRLAVSQVVAERAGTDGFGFADTRRGWRRY